MHPLRMGLYSGTHYIAIKKAEYYSRIHTSRGEWMSPISQSILNQLSGNFTHTIFHSCRDYPESFAKFR